jgi:hypothetical protein
VSRGTTPFVYLRFMPRKRWSSQKEVTPELLKTREKRKWQIALRRYVLEENPCVSYAPYFGLDIANFKKWISLQFSDEMSWDNFGRLWQFEHVVPLAYFDFALEEDLKLCWNFINIRIEYVKDGKDKNKLSVLSSAKAYFETLYQTTGYFLCGKMISRINQIEEAKIPLPEKEQDFLLKNKEYLELIYNYSAFEFELLNSGRDISEVIKEINFLKKF